jgi:uncharacterized protein YdaU (DUF1376 family)
VAIQKPTWFRMDPAQFFSDAQVDAMSTLELGACFRLLGRQWIDGYIPDDLRVLGRLCRLDDSGMREAWDTLSAFFPVVEAGKRANRFMWIERAKVVADLERKSDEGTRYARKRWIEARKRNASPNATPNAEGNGSPIAPLTATPNGSPIPEPMQEKIRVDQIRSQSEDATGMPDPSSNFNPTEIAQILCQQNGWSGRGMIWALEAAIDFQAKRMPENELKEVGEWLVGAYSEHKVSKGTFAVGPQKFFEQGLYRPAADQRKAKAELLTNNPATRMLAQMESA